MWEKVREDGKRVLKCNAIPTIFSHRTTPKRRKPPSHRHSPRKNKIPDTQESIETRDPPLSMIGVQVDENINSCPKSPISTALPDSENPTPSLFPLSTELELKYLKERLKAYKKHYGKIVKQNCLLKLKCQKLQNIVKEYKTKNSMSTNNKLRQVFNEDQIKFLQRKKTSWSNRTIRKALSIKFSCGNAGYEELLNQNHPLPSLRTLRRKIQNLQFQSGILHEVLQFLKIKINLLSRPEEKHCVLLLDEMSITAACEYDNGDNAFIGNVTLPSHHGEATHALVFMLGGVSSRWKQTVAYYFTGDSSNGAVYRDIIFEIIQATKEIGLSIVAVVSDMGSPNQGFWKSVGIKAGRYSETTNYFLDPCDETRKIYVIPDAVHIFKNIKGMLANNKQMTIPQNIATQFDLPSVHINFSDIEELAEFQENLVFKLSPKLKEEDLHPSQFKKMRVSTSSNVISHAVSSGLKFLADELNKPEYATTAWFLDLVEKWFAIMTSRNPLLALSKYNDTTYNETIQFLYSFMEIFSSLKIGTKGAWKPVQTGVVLCTKSIIDIQATLLNDNNYKFVLTSRFTQDSLENLFSLVRAKQPAPTALQFKQNLKLIMLSQYMKDVKKGNYDEDDRETLTGFLEHINTSNHTQEEKEPELPDDFQINSLELSPSEMNSLYCLLGYIIKSINHNSKHCNECIISLGNKKPYGLPYERLTKIKCFKDNTLWFPSESTFKFVLQMEEIFSNYIEVLKAQKINLKKYFVSKIKQEISVSHIPQCHDLLNTLISRYITFRLKISSKRRKNQNVFSSKSMAALTSYI